MMDARTWAQADSLNRMLSDDFTNADALRRALKTEAARADSLLLENERLRARLTEARDYVGKNYMPSGLIARIDAALKGGEGGGEDYRSALIFPCGTKVYRD